VLVETGIDGSRVEAQGSVDGRCKSPTRGSEKHNRAVLRVDMEAMDEQATEDIVEHVVVHCNECVISGAHRFGHAGK
jgi:hypothetical protein